MKQATSFWRRLFDYLRNGFVLSKTVLFISGLVLSHALVQKAVLDVLVDFLTEAYFPSLRKAIVLANMLYLILAVFKVGVTHISEAYTGPFNVIIFCTAAYIMGLMLLWFRTWLILATVLIALGKAGEEPSVRDFFDYQLSEKVRRTCSEENNRSGTSSNNLWSTTASFIGDSIAIFWLGKSKIEWSEKFKVSSIFMGSTYLLFFCGIFCYYPEVMRSIGSPITTIYRVFMAAIQKRRLPYPSSKESYYSIYNSNLGSNESEKKPTSISSLITKISRVFKAAIEKRRTMSYPCSDNDLQDPFYRGENGEVHLLPRNASFYFLLFLDKAAIIKNNEKFDAARGNKERYEEAICTAEQVRDVKSLYPLIPLAFTFFPLSLTFACGNTYFVLQAQNLNPKVGGGFIVPIMVFFSLQSLVAFAVTTIQHPIRKLVKPAWRIAVGMFCSVLCCIAASLVELYGSRSLSIMVLTPQYFLLGLMQGFAEYGVEAFLCMGVPVSMIKFVEPCVQMLLATGNFFSILFMLIFHSWIKDSINSSHLDRYFLMLASLSFVFFGIYVICVKFKLLKLPQFEEPLQTNNQGIIGEMSDPLELLVENISNHEFHV